MHVCMYVRFSKESRLEFKKETLNSMPAPMWYFKGSRVFFIRSTSGTVTSRDLVLRNKDKSLVVKRTRRKFEEDPRGWRERRLPCPRGSGPALARSIVYPRRIKLIGHDGNEVRAEEGITNIYHLLIKRLVLRR